MFDDSLGLLFLGMDALETELSRLQRDAALSQSVEHVDKILEQLCRARDAITAGEGATSSFAISARKKPYIY